VVGEAIGGVRHRSAGHLAGRTATPSARA
jgi:hypothetical protein